MREPTAIDAIADAHVEAMVAHSPLAATYLGVPGRDGELDDFSPASAQRWADEVRSTLARLEAEQPADDVDRVTLAAMRERLGLELEDFEAGDHLADLNNIASPIQAVRDVFDLMPTDDPSDWDTIAARLRAVPAALRSYEEALAEGIARGIVPARRQVLLGQGQAERTGDPQRSELRALVDRAPRGHSGLAAALDEATAAYRALAVFLRDELAPAAPEEDAVGRDRYARGSRYFVGATIDLDETYEWGVAALREIAAEQEELARRIAGPGASVADAVAALNQDPRHTLTGTAALREWMQVTSDEAISALDGEFFDIPAPLKRLECRIAPSQTGAIYYTGPSEDFTRPGRMWWSVPESVDTFHTWLEKTTVYHEGVPGHHLQIGTATHNSDQLNRWRRQLFISGHGEGWALYAERLMDEFGFLATDGDRFGMLDSQRLRAVRVVVDLGVHLGKPAFEEYGGGTWDFDKALRLMRDNVLLEEPQLRFELERYMGWPGQAPSYRVGQRIWEQVRDEARGAAEARGEEFDLRGFHSRALGLGAVPLDVLREAMLR